MTNVNNKKKQRFLFLNRLYELTGGSQLKVVQIHDVATSLGFFVRDEVADICLYLKNEGLADPRNMAISITHFGIKEVEAALSEPDKPSHYFPPVNVINVHQMNNSVIQQGNLHSQQSASFSEVVGDLIKLLSSLVEAIPELMLKDEARAELDADIKTIQVQLDSKKPKKAIIKESLRSVQRILEGAAGSVVGQSLLNHIDSLLVNLGA